MIFGILPALIVAGWAVVALCVAGRRVPVAALWISPAAGVVACLTAMTWAFFGVEDNPNDIYLIGPPHGAFFGFLYNGLLGLVACIIIAVMTCLVHGFVYLLKINRGRQGY